MPSPGTPPQRLMLARQLIREKGLSRTDLALLEDILREGAGVLDPLLGPAPQEAVPAPESPAQANLRRNLGIFLAFLHQFSARRLGESRAAMGLVMQHSLGRLGHQAETAHRELMVELKQPEWVGQLLDLLADKTINGRIAKEVFEAMVETGDAPAAIVEAKGLRQVVDTGAIDAAVDKVLAANPDKVAEYKGGKDKLFGFFVGQVMKAMAGKGNPALVNDAIKAKLG